MLENRIYENDEAPIKKSTQTEKSYHLPKLLKRLPKISKRPIDNDFSQQRLPTWTPLLEPYNTGLSFCCYSLFSFMVAVGLIINNYYTFERVFDYTYCPSSNDENCTIIQGFNKSICQCVLEFHLRDDVKLPVYVHYQLNNFHQNYRFYYQSRDDLQLQGNYDEPLNSKCKPILYQDPEKKEPYTPCGLIANSLFNDTFSLYLHKSYNDESFFQTGFINWTNKGISWYSDKTLLFGRIRYKRKYATPPNWNRSLWNRTNKPFQSDEELIVWMRCAAMPTFKKFHRIINGEMNVRLDYALPRGIYYIVVNNNFPVAQFNGKKSIIFSKTSLLGGINRFVPLGFLILSCVHLLLGAYLIQIKHHTLDFHHYHSLGGVLELSDEDDFTDHREIFQFEQATQSEAKYEPIIQLEDVDFSKIDDIQSSRIFVSSNDWQKSILNRVTKRRRESQKLPSDVFVDE